MITWTQQKLGVIAYLFYILICFTIGSLIIFIYIGQIGYVIMHLIATLIIIYLLVAFYEMGKNYYKSFPAVDEKEIQKNLLKYLKSKHTDTEDEIISEGITMFKMQQLGLTIYLNYKTEEPNMVIIKVVGVKENNYTDAVNITEFIDDLFINRAK